MLATITEQKAGMGKEANSYEVLHLEMFPRLNHG